MKIDITPEEQKVIYWALRLRLFNITEEIPYLFSEKKFNSEIIFFNRKRIKKTYLLIEKFKP